MPEGGFPNMIEAYEKGMKATASGKAKVMDFLSDEKCELVLPSVQGNFERSDPFV
jgi:hypothetical protein